jgi:hypothetical protein
MEPPKSFACAIGTIPEATAAADPPLEPPVDRAGSQGLRAGPDSSGSQVSEPPNSLVLLLPIRTSPARRYRPTSSESRADTLAISHRLPSV